ncbi:SigE family RNA polymerase sigma factor [Cryptosporangium aurantiacum]|uniref:RNA polymerase, sigma subunit, SigV n=1 Tax=Cryptosporangium aurantiacum TaxID=134849 RepID=A0A1M7R2W7_9ACTN|nr:SigE family RNA polymerase sigma factor [Cryptosporangium aurantiacum]SHN38951.1 RNA polymerase, sigma subunit, SigV [Cryptosporangium aurantiacum]
MPSKPDAAAFDGFVADHGGTFLRFAYVLCGDYHLAEDLVQEALVRVHPRWPKVRQQQPSAYVRKTILRQYLSWRRRRASAEVPDLPDADANQDRRPDHADRLADRDALRIALAGLPPRQRAVLVLRFYEDLDDDEIAELIGCSTTTVRSHASRGLARLRGDAHVVPIA